MYEEYKHKWYLKNRDRIIKNNREYYQINKAIISEKNKERYCANYDLIMKQHKEYYKNHKEETSKQCKTYYEKNREDILKYAKIYRDEHRKERNIYQGNRDKTDLKFNLDKKIGNAIRKALKGNKAGRRWEDLVGYTLDDLKMYLEKTMPNGYTWQDYLEGRLHIDHIIPISVHNYLNSEHTDFQRCWSLSNLRLLPAKENMCKNDKLFKPFQPALKLNIAGVI